MNDMTLPHRLDRRIRIAANRETVFSFFTDGDRWASWWGPGSTVDARPGGRLLIRYPNGVEAAGEVVSVDPPERIVFTYGYVSGQPIPPGGSRVTIRLEAGAGETRLHLAHEFAEAGVRDHHVQGWRYQLSLFANAVANEIHAGAAGHADTWFAAWREKDAAARARLLESAAVPGVEYRDRHSLVEGLEDLLSYIDATQRFMPDVVPHRQGEVRQCQGTALADWTATGADGAEVARGTNVFRLGADGRIESVVGLWAAPAGGR